MSMEYLSTSIASIGAPTLPNQKPPSRNYAVRAVNRTDDIEGATPALPYSAKYTNKPTSFDVIDGSMPRKQTHERNVPDLSLMIDDIDGTRHSIKDRMMRTKRHVNPLKPEYPLPSFIPSDIPETNFTRDTLTIRDIDGSYTKPARQYQTRDTMSTQDIEGAQACYRPAYRRARLENPPHGIMDNEGVVFKKTSFQDRCTRSTNLTEPVYFVNGVTIQNEEKSHPKPLKKHIQDNALLQTRDIDGAYPAWNQRPRREVRNIMSTMDVPGAQADTVIHSMKSDRVTNPLMPVFTSLDGKPLEPLVKPLMPDRFVEQPTLRPQKQSVQQQPRGVTPGSTPRVNVPELTIPKLSSNQNEAPANEYKASSFADRADNGNTFV